MEQEKTIEQLVAEQIDKHKSEIIKNGFEAIKVQCSNTISWQIEKEVNKQFASVFEDEALKKAMLETTETLRTDIVNAFSSQLRGKLPEIGAAFAELVHKRIIKNLTDPGYRVKDALAELLKE